ncbi:adenosine deaminase [Siculibacillus lacustris]|uniref:Adenine deaminase n=1 Tax=Siculibacillus lacustris TaxID=1549641 RepID=A0A4V2KTC1_9HYPH|nr:adenosine deaminase [Siculibacillus lacustris]TBW36614.1 adenosine deaminase [Siculibacillus lacustris]
MPTLSPSLAAFLAEMPKIELHVHVEGTLEPETIFALAKRNGVALPYADVEALRAAYAFTDLQSFLDVYYAGAGVLLTADDFHDMVFAYLERAHADRVVRAEIFFDPQTHTARGVAMATVIGGLTAGCAAARAALGIESVLILCFLRHLDEDDALATLEAALPHREKFVGVGLDSSEVGHPPEKFARVFARAQALGLRLVAHAGEEGPPAYVTSALDVLGAERIDHGVRSLEDPVLTARLAAGRVALTVCPLSNLKLRVVDTLADHPLGRMLDAGLAATINSDDPAYFGGYVGQNWLETFEALGLDRDAAIRLSKNAIDAAFVDAAGRAALHAQYDAFVAGFDPV